jgi:Uma2 family endonuclease
MGPVSAKHDKALPPLQSGDHLTGAEFERRLPATSEEGKAELIDGVVYMVPPVGFDHSVPHARLMSWLGHYVAYTQGVEASDNGTLRLDKASRPQPDASLWILPEAGGRVRMDPDRVLAGTVELVAEVAASSASYDLHEKKKAFARQGVPEYLVHVVHSNELLWFWNDEGEYVAKTADAQGVVHSTIFPGLWLDEKAFLAGEMASVLDTLRRGLASEEHVAFAAELRARLESKKD